RAINSKAYGSHSRNGRGQLIGLIPWLLDNINISMKVDKKTKGPLVWIRQRKSVVQNAPKALNHLFVNLKRITSNPPPRHRSIKRPNGYQVLSYELIQQMRGPISTSHAAAAIGSYCERTECRKMRLHQGHSGPNKGPTNLKPLRSEEEKGTEEEKRVVLSSPSDQLLLLQNMGADPTKITSTSHLSDEFNQVFPESEDEGLEMTSLLGACAHEEKRQHQHQLCNHPHERLTRSPFFASHSIDSASRATNSNQTSSSSSSRDNPVLSALDSVQNLGQESILRLLPIVNKFSRIISGLVQNDLLVNVSSQNLSILSISLVGSTVLTGLCLFPQERKKLGVTQTGKVFAPAKTSIITAMHKDRSHLFVREVFSALTNLTATDVPYE
ncbi:hypothetical protein PROFUN_16896, partial [Planoprotostelium fungivorum]